jgi:hypothetical protein
VLAALGLCPGPDSIDRDRRHLFPVSRRRMPQGLEILDNSLELFDIF